MILHLQRVFLAVSRGKTYLLQDITFAVEPRQRLAIVGASGAGKTSLLRLLNRLQDPASGEIFFEGRPSRQIPVPQLRRQIVLVPQEPKLLAPNVRDALVYPLQLQKLPRREILDRLETWTSRLQIPREWFDRSELQLSLGQRQLIAIARGLLLQPKILLLDEPTSALDVGTATRLFETLSSQGDLTVLTVNHQLELVKTWADRVIYLREGRIAADLAATEADWQELRLGLIAPGRSNPGEEWEEWGDEGAPPGSLEKR